MRKNIDFQSEEKTVFRVVGDNNDFALFSEVEIIYNSPCGEVIVFKDFLGEGINTLRTMLIKVSKLKLQTFDINAEDRMGLLWNEYCNKLNSGEKDIEDLTDPYHLWSTANTIGIETWIYNIGNRIIFEISPTYKWHFEESNNIDAQTYEQFKAGYEPIVAFEVSKKTAIKWIELCKNILDSGTMPDNK